MVEISVDLETMSSEPNAAIVAIGAVAFDMSGDLLGSDPRSVGFYTNVDLQSCIDLGLHVSGSTVMWWLEQSEEARKALTTPPIERLERALIHFVNWTSRVGVAEDVHLWSHATFDAPILSHAYNVCRDKAWQPWRFRNARDIRTIVDLAYGSDTIPNVPDTNKHHALYDAWRQAIMVQTCWRKLHETELQGQAAAIRDQQVTVNNNAGAALTTDPEQLRELAGLLKPYLAEYQVGR